MAKYTLNAFKYYYDTKEITEEEYFDYMCNDLADCGYKVNKQLVRKAISEDRYKAWITGCCNFYMSAGKVLSIKKEEVK